MEIFEERLTRIVSIEQITWLDDAKYRAENPWLRMAQAIAIQIAEVMDILNMTEEELSEKTNISLERIDSIMRGKEDMSLQTISKLEIALNTKLITMEYDFDNLETGELENKETIILDDAYSSNNRKYIRNPFKYEQIFVLHSSISQEIEQPSALLAM